MRLGFILICSSALAACSGADTGGDMGTQADLPPSDLLPPPPDLAYFHEVDGGGVLCGASTCAAGAICCVTGTSASTTRSCASSCPDGGAVIACDAPAQCGGNPCCFTLFNDPIAEATSACTASPDACPGMDPFGNPLLSRGCKYDGDCTAGLAPMHGFLNCCHLVGDGTRICWGNGLIKMGIGPPMIACP